MCYEGNILVSTLCSDFAHKAINKANTYIVMKAVSCRTVQLKSLNIDAGVEVLELLEYPILSAVIS